jgi:intracellular sulfur oxidation DsrE/DsrF family protein
MSDKTSYSSMARRLFLSRLGMGAGVVGAAVAGSSSAMAQATGNAAWRPAKHDQDDWFDQIPGKHRIVFDTTTPEAINLASQFGNTFYTANNQAYGLKENEIAMVIVLRHKSTTFGYNDTMWAKYGKQFAIHAILPDAVTKDGLTINLFTSGKPSTEFANAGRMSELIKHGTQFGVCATASRGIAGAIARATGGDADKIFDEMGANLIPNARRVPAGIVAISRAQERGYTFVHAM